MREGDRVKLTAEGIQVMSKTRKRPPPEWRGTILRRHGRIYENCERVQWDHETAPSTFHIRFIEPA